MKLKHYCCLLVILSVQIIAAQSFENEEYLKCLSSVESKLNSGETDSAIKESNNYLSIIKRSKGQEHKANALYTKLVACYGLVADLNAVDSVLKIQLKWMKKYGGTHLDWGKFYHNKSKILQLKGKSKLALTGMQMAICRKWISVPRDYKTIIASYREAGKIADELDHNLARYFYDQAYTLVSKLKQPDPAMEYDLLDKYSQHLILDGEYDLIEKLYKRAELFQYPNEYVKITNTILTALNYSEYVLIPKERLGEAKRYLNNAKFLAIKYQILDKIPSLDISLANLDFIQQNYKSAAPKYIDAYSRQILSNQTLDLIREMRTISNIIESFIQIKDVKSAWYWLDKYLTLKQKYQLNQIGIEFEYLFFKARIAFLKDPKETIISDLIVKLKEYGCPIDQPLTEKTFLNFRFLEGYLFLILEMIHSLPEIANQVSWQNKIINLCLRKLEVFDYRKSFQVNAKVNFGINDNYEKAIQEGLVTGYKLFKKTKDKAVFVKVCQLSEKYKNNLLYSNLKMNQKESSDLPQDLQNEEKLIIKKIKNALTEYSQGFKENNIEEQVNTLKDYKTWLIKIAKQFPKYYHQKYQFQLFDYEQFHEKIKNDSICYLSYTRISHEIIVNWTTKSNYGIESLAANKNFDGLITKLTEAIESKSSIESFVNPANELFKVLLSFLPKNISKLVISHDGQLNKIPFDLLVTSILNSGTWKTVPFLIKEKTIYYSPGWTALTYENEFENKLPYTYWGLCYNPIPDNKENLAPIPMACVEIKDCAQIWNSKKAKITESGTISDMLQASKSAQIIHIASHAFAHPLNGSLSYLWLGDSVYEKGIKLTAAELYKWNIKCQLTILSSCQSGGGAKQKGEGIIGLTRAFLFAGSRNIVSNLWSVPDFQTKILVTDFIKNINAGQSFDVAIRNSKLKYLENQMDKYAHPYFWGAMILSSIESNTSYTNKPGKPLPLLLVAAICLAITTLVLLIRK